MTTQSINLDDQQTLDYVGEYLDGRLNGLLRDWTVAEYVARRRLDDERQKIGGLSADADDDDSEQEN